MGAGDHNMAMWCRVTAYGQMYIITIVKHANGIDGDGKWNMNELIINFHILLRNMVHIDTRILNGSQIVGITILIRSCLAQVHIPKTDHVHPVDLASGG